MTVLLWGRSTDAVVEAVAQACTELGLDVVAADGEEIMSVAPDGMLVTRAGPHISLEDVTGVLVRPESEVKSRESAIAFGALTAWTELTRACVLNRPSAAASNRSKPFQLGLIAGLGFAVPDTLVTTDPEDVRAFRAQHGTVVYKSVSGVRSIVAMLRPDDDERLCDVSTCPTQFQRFIAGIDHRVHVVNEAVFACRVDSAAIDYRYAAHFEQCTTLTAVTLPRDVANRCIKLTHGLELQLAGIDLRVSPDGTWWCFEVNTAPGFTWFEQQTGQPIAAAVARTLAGHRAERSRTLMSRYPSQVS